MAALIMEELASKPGWFWILCPPLEQFNLLQLLGNVCIRPILNPFLLDKLVQL